jgi:flagellar protein FlaI
MATGHTTYSTFHADSAQSLIHRLEGKPIDIPRIMLQSLDIVTLQVSAKLGEKRVRRVKQIVEIVNIDPVTKEILTNEVFRWDPVEDTFIYSGKSYVLERIRSQYDLSKEGMVEEVKRRVEILEWLRQHNIREFKDVAKIVALYAETPDMLVEKIRNGDSLGFTKINDEEQSTDQHEEMVAVNNDSDAPGSKQSHRSFFFNRKKHKQSSKKGKKGEVHGT